MQLNRYIGILNGIDTTIWNPASDVFLPAKFHGNIFLSLIFILNLQHYVATLLYNLHFLPVGP